MPARANEVGRGIDAAGDPGQVEQAMKHSLEGANSWARRVKS